MKKKYIFIVIVVFFGLMVAGQVVSELPIVVQALYTACLFGGAVWGFVWVITNKRFNAWLLKELKEVLRHLRG